MVFSSRGDVLLLPTTSLSPLQDDPYPTPEDKMRLGEMTGLSVKQVTFFPLFGISPKSHPRLTGRLLVLEQVSSRRKRVSIVFLTFSSRRRKREKRNKGAKGKRCELRQAEDMPFK
jgi:hypothetical protein